MGLRKVYVRIVCTYLGLGFTWLSLREWYYSGHIFTWISFDELIHCGSVAEFQREDVLYFRESGGKLFN